MTEDLQALEEAVVDLLRDNCSPDRLAAVDGSLDRGLWKVLDEAGLTRVGVPEAAGGSGGSLADAAVILRLAGEYSAPVPLAEHGLIAGSLLASAGLPLPDGIVTVGTGEMSAVRSQSGWQLTGSLSRVGYAREADVIVGVASATSNLVVFVLPRDATTSSPGTNLAGEPRDDVTVDLVLPDDAVAVAPAGAGDELLARGALARVLMLAGAAQAALSLVLRYAGERQQFGRPIGAFQAVQHMVAGLASEAAAARAAADAAVQAAAADLTAPAARFAIAAAKVRTAQAAGVIAAAAHQVHGAIGMTEEHALRFTTTRLWSWRDEWGSEPLCAADVGRLAVGPDDTLWSLLVGA
jgi:acyl-CoA dehydrogenase